LKRRRNESVASQPLRTEAARTLNLKKKTNQGKKQKNKKRTHLEVDARLFIDALRIVIVSPRFGEQHFLFLRLRVRGERSGPNSNRVAARTVRCVAAQHVVRGLAPAHRVLNEVIEQTDRGLWRRAARRESKQKNRFRRDDVTKEQQKNRRERSRRNTRLCA
jgi:hypothetical protein